MRDVNRRQVVKMTALGFAVAGVAAGLALASKYTAALLGVGIGVWILVTPRMRPWLARPAPWLALGLAGALFSPVVLWNGEHGWAGFFKQGGRVGSWEPERAFTFLGELIGSQIGLATPLIASIRC